MTSKEAKTFWMNLPAQEPVIPTNGKFILRGHVPVPCHDLLKWAKWFEKSNKCVATTKIKSYFVSTIFLGLNHNFDGDRPLLFETIVFNPNRDQEIQRYCTWDEAVAGHKAMVSLVRVQLRLKRFSATKKFISNNFLFLADAAVLFVWLFSYSLATILSILSIMLKFWK